MGDAESPDESSEEEETFVRKPTPKKTSSVSSAKGIVHRNMFDRKKTRELVDWLVIQKSHLVYKLEYGNLHQDAGCAFSSGMKQSFRNTK